MPGMIRPDLQALARYFQLAEKWSIAPCRTAI